LQGAQMGAEELSPPSHLLTLTTDCLTAVAVWWLVRSGASPYPGITAEHLCNVLKTGYRMDKPPACSDQLYVTFM